MIPSICRMQDNFAWENKTSYCHNNSHRIPDIKIELPANNLDFYGKINIWAWTWGLRCVRLYSKRNIVYGTLWLQPHLNVDSRVDPNTRTMGIGQPYARVDLNSVPESTLSPSQGLRLWPLKSRADVWGSQAEIGKNVIRENSILYVHTAQCTVYMSHKDNLSNMEDDSSLYNVLWHIICHDMSAV